jgi:anti-sigma factor RsiW
VIRRISDNDERLLNALLNGELPEEEAFVLRRRLQAEPELAAAYEALDRLNGLLKRRGGDQPEVDFAGFRADVMAQVRRSPGPSAGEIDERDAQRVSAWLDGDLDGDSREEVEEKLALDPALREARDVYAGIDALLEARRVDQPDVEWGRFRSEVMASVRAEGRAGRLIRFPRWAVGLSSIVAAAAAIALVLTLDPIGLRGPKPTPGPGNGDDSTIGQKLVVHVVHDEPARPTEAAEKIHVDYSRSAELASVTRAEDEARQRQKWGYASQTPAEPSPANENDIARAIQILEESGPVSCIFDRCRYRKGADALAAWTA